MIITLTPEHERLIQAQMATGQFHSIDEVLTCALTAFQPPAPADFNKHRNAKAQAAAERIRELRKGVTLERPAGMSMREYTHAGHKY